MIKRKRAFVSTETTGLSFGESGFDEMIELTFCQVDEDGNVLEKSEKSRRFRSNIPIPKEASAIHGIYDADVQHLDKFQSVSMSFMRTIASSEEIVFFNEFHLRVFLYSLGDAGHKHSEILDILEGMSVCVLSDSFKVQDGETAFTADDAIKLVNDGHVDMRTLLTAILEMRESPNKNFALNKIFPKTLDNLSVGYKKVCNSEKLSKMIHIHNGIDSDTLPFFIDGKPNFNVFPSSMFETQTIDGVSDVLIKAGKHKGKSASSLDEGYYQWLSSNRQQNQKRNTILEKFYV